MEAEQDTKRLDSILAEIKDRRSSGHVIDVEEKKTLMVIFGYRDELMAFEGGCVREILRAGRINPVPGSPRVFAGVINLRGSIESVADFNIAMGTDTQDSAAGKKIVIVENGGIRTGVLVDSVDDVAEIPSSSITPVTVQHDKNFFSGETFVGARHISIVDSALFLKSVVSQV